MAVRKKLKDGREEGYMCDVYRCVRVYMCAKENARTNGFPVYKNFVRKVIHINKRVRQL